MARPLKTARKDPDAILDYSFDWTDWLESGDSLVDATWTLDTGITMDSEELSATVSKIWVSGGTAGTSYTVACKVTTLDDREAERSIEIVVEEK